MSRTHEKLRSATAEAHERVENRARVIERLADAAERPALMAAFYALHAEVEAAAEPWLGDHPELDFEGRRRTPMLRESLDALGLAAPALTGAVTATSAAEAMGLLYVVEGATLGGKVIRKRLSARGGDLAGLAFLDPYGEAVSERWRTFLDVLDGVGEADSEAAVSGALQGFRLAEQRLCGDAR